MKLAGSGVLYMNNSTKWSSRGTARFSFQVSPDGRQIIGFRGSYRYYCGTGTGTVTASFIDLKRDGSFSYQFDAPDTENHRAGERTYVSIVGRFIDNGLQVSLGYLVNTAPTTLPHPYATSRPHKLGCASWVRGTAAPRTRAAPTAGS